MQKDNPPKGVHNAIMVLGGDRDHNWEWSSNHILIPYRSMDCEILTVHPHHNLLHHPLDTNRSKLRPVNGLYAVSMQDPI